MADNQVLSQAEIDALLGARPGDVEVKPEPRPEPQPEEESPVNIVAGRSQLPDYAAEDAKATSASHSPAGALEGLEAVAEPEGERSAPPVQNTAEAPPPQPAEAAPNTPAPAPQAAPPAEASPLVLAEAAAPPPQTEAGSAVSDPANERIRALEQGMADLNAAMQNMQQGYQAIVQHLNSMNAYIQDLRGNAKATPGHGLRTVFVCERCAAKGSVATRIQCTNCGDESWWGWWPEG